MNRSTRTLALILLGLALLGAAAGNLPISTGPTTEPAWGPVGSTEPCVTVNYAAGPPPSLTLTPVPLRNPQSGSSPYAIATTDNCKIVERQQSANTADTIVAATTSGYGDGFAFMLFNLGAGTETLTATTSTFTCTPTFCSGSVLTLAAGQAAYIYSNGVNYRALVWH